MIRFVHSGDLGDIISSLAVVKEICERKKDKALLYLDISGGMKYNPSDISKIINNQTSGRGMKFDENGYNFIRPVLIYQSYIDDVQIWKGEEVDYNLNKFRLHFIKQESCKKTQGNLMKLHQIAFDLSLGIPKEPLITPSNPITIDNKTIVIGRSLRYQSAHIFILMRREFIQNQGLFIGTDLEYEAFQNSFNIKPDRYPVNNVMDIVNIMSGTKQIICNDTLFFWIAISIKHPFIIDELCLDLYSCFFPNEPNIHYVQGSRFL